MNELCCRYFAGLRLFLCLVLLFVCVCVWMMMMISELFERVRSAAFHFFSSFHTIVVVFDDDVVVRCSLQRGLARHVDGCYNLRTYGQT